MMEKENRPLALIRTGQPIALTSIAPHTGCCLGTNHGTARHMDRHVRGALLPWGDFPTSVEGE